MGMKKFILGASSEEKPNLEATDGKTGVDSDDEVDFMDTDEDETGAAPPADYIPLNIVKKAPKTSECAAEKGEDTSAAEPVEPNSFFVVDTKPTPVNLNGTSKKSRKRAKEEDSGEQKSAKKAKKEKAVAAEPKPAIDSERTSASNSNPSRVDDIVAQPKVKSGDAPKDKPKSFKVDFSSIEAKLQADIEAGTKAKEERQKLQAEMKLARKDKKRKRLSEGSSEKEMKKPKQQDPEKEVEKNEDDVTNIEKPDKEAIPFVEKDVDTVDKDVVEVEKKVSKGKPKNDESNSDEHGEKMEKTGAENLAKTAKKKKKESKKRKAENRGDEGVLTDEGGKKKSKVIG
jgi:hypothetical protein